MVNTSSVNNVGRPLRRCSQHNFHILKLCNMPGASAYSLHSNKCKQAARWSHQLNTPSISKNWRQGLPTQGEAYIPTPPALRCMPKGSS